MRKILLILMVVLMIALIVVFYARHQQVEKVKEIADKMLSVSKILEILVANKALFAPEEYKENFDYLTLALDNLEKAVKLLKAWRPGEEYLNQAQNYLDKVEKSLIAKKLL